MGERLTEEDDDERIARLLARNWPLTASEGRRAAGLLRAARQQALSEEDREALRWARDMARLHANDSHGFEEADMEPPRRALAVLDKLLKGGA